MLGTIILGILVVGTAFVVVVATTRLVYRHFLRLEAKPTPAPDRLMELFEGDHDNEPYEPDDEDEPDMAYSAQYPFGEPCLFLNGRKLEPDDDYRYTNGRLVLLFLVNRNSRLTSFQDGVMRPLGHEGLLFDLSDSELMTVCPPSWVGEGYEEEPDEEEDLDYSPGARQSPISEAKEPETTSGLPLLRHERPELV